MTDTGTEAPASPLRTVDGATLPLPGTYAIDTAHTSIDFAVRHLGLAKVRGHFRAFDGVIEIADRPEDSTVAVDVDLTSLDTRDPRRDESLRSGNFFDVANHPTMAFRSSRVTGSGTSWTVEGDLTVRGVTHPITLDVAFEGAAVDPWGGQRIAFAASGEVDRERWGMTWNQALEAGGFAVGRKAHLHLEVQAVRQPPTA